MLAPRLAACLLILAAVLANGCRQRGSTSDAEPPDVPPPLIGDPMGGASVEDLKSSKKGLRVLFVGNSYTFFNNLPDMVTRLAKAAGEEMPLLAVQEAPGGVTLEQHARGPAVAKWLADVKWDYVVLQEQSQRPSFAPQQVAREVYPAVRQLHAKIKENGARTLLFQTWGYKDGDRRSVPGDTYGAMQERLRRGYGGIAKELKIDVVPVGTAWELALKKDTKLDLWGPDGSHPSASGTYLAACVFYAQLYGKSPAGNSFTAGLGAAEAKLLQEAAWAAVEQGRGGKDSK